MKILLVVLFLVDGDIIIDNDGWAPLEVESLQVCDIAKGYIVEYLKNSETFLTAQCIAL